MKILIDARVLQTPITGVAKATLGLYEACFMVQPDLDVSLMHRKPLTCAVPSQMQSLHKYQAVPDPIWRRLLLRQFVVQYQPDAVHFPWNGDVPALPADAAIVTTLHDVLPLEIPGYFQDEKSKDVYKRRIQRDIDRTDLLITDSEYSKRKIIENFRLKTEPMIIYLDSPLNGEYTPAAAETNVKDDYFLYVGGYHQRKGVVQLLKVFTHLHRQNRISTKLLLVGSQDYVSEEFQRLLEEARSQNCIKEIGYVTDSQLRTLYLGAKALVYPSRYEGFGLPPLEAMALGCPVLTTRCTSIPEICGDAACYIEPDDNPGFAAALVAVDKNIELRTRLRTKGLAQAAKFSWERSAETFLDALSRAIEQKRNRR